MRRAAIWIAALALAATSCSAPRPLPPDDPRHGQVAYEEVDPSAAGVMRMTLAPNESFQLPLADPANAAPEYPPGLLARRLPPRVVCMRLAVGEDGSVRDAQPVVSDDDCPAAANGEQAFPAATAEAVRRWRFDPAFRCVFPEGQAVTSTCDGVDGREVPQAVSLIFRFVFEQIDGRAEVRFD